MLFGETRDDVRQLEPARALFHPAWLGALALLVVNDHVLKSALDAPWLTGKLSDFAGLLVAPVLVAAIFRVRRMRGLVASATVVAGLFAAINLSPALAASWDQLMGTLGIGWVTYSDPTDCVALIVAPTGIAMFQPWMKTPLRIPHRRPVAYALAMSGAIACLATSPPPGEFEPVPVEFQSRLALLNRTNELQVLRIRNLASDLNIDCDRVAEAPAEYLTAEAFGDAVRWELFSGQQLGLGINAQTGRPMALGEDDCRATRISLETAPDIVVFWRGDLEPKTFRANPEGEKQDLGGPQTIMLNGDYFQANSDDIKSFRYRPCEEGAPCGDEGRREAARIPDGAVYAWMQKGAKQHFHEIPNRTERERNEPPRSCVQAMDSPGIAWEELPEDRRRVDAIEQGADGCHTLTLAIPQVEGPRAPEPEKRIVCAPWGALRHLSPSGKNRKVFIETSRPRKGFVGEDEWHTGLKLRVDIGDESNANLSSGTIYLTRGTVLPDTLAMDLQVEPMKGCGPFPTTCGEVEIPGEVRVSFQSEARTVRPGESGEFSDGFPRSFHLAQAVERPVVRPSSACESEESMDDQTAQPDPSVYFEAASVVGLNQSNR